MNLIHVSKWDPENIANGVIFALYMPKYDLLGDQIC